MSADVPTPDKANLCSRRQEEGHCCPARWLLEAVWKERKIQPSSRNGRELKGKDSPSKASDGQEMIAPWNVDVKHGHGEAHSDQIEADGKHCSNSRSTGTVLHFVCGCSFVCK